MRENGAVIATVALLSTVSLFSFGVAVGRGESSPDRGVEPRPTPTVTVTASAAPQPRATLPQECLDYYANAQKVPAAVAAYEEQLGGTGQMQNLGVQGILQQNMKMLNASRQGLIDLQNATIQSLEDLNTLQNDLATGAKACREAMTK